MSLDRFVAIIVCIGILFTGLVAVSLQREETQTQQFPEITDAITGMINVGFTITSFAVIFVSAAGILIGVLAWLGSKA